MNDSAGVLFFVKAPLPGYVKSRLAAKLGEKSAQDLYRAFGIDMIAMLDRIGCSIIVCFDPPDAADSVIRWLGEQRSYLPQEGEDLGVRMEHAFRSLFESGSERAILVGSDIPDLPQEIVTEALRELESHDAVIGPAADGGYYLIGFRRERFRPEVFKDVPWSTGTVFQETLHRFSQAGSRVHVLPQWQDADTIDDLRALLKRSEGTDFERSHTIPVLREACGKIKVRS